MWISGYSKWRVSLYFFYLFTLLIKYNLYFGVIRGGLIYFINLRAIKSIYLKWSIGSTQPVYNSHHAGGLSSSIAEPRKVHHIVRHIVCSMTVYSKMCYSINLWRKRLICCWPRPKFNQIHPGKKSKGTFLKTIPSYISHKDNITKFHNTCVFFYFISSY